MAIAEKKVNQTATNRTQMIVDIVTRSTVDKELCSLRFDNMILNWKKECTVLLFFFYPWNATPAFDVSARPPPANPVPEKK